MSILPETTIGRRTTLKAVAVGGMVALAGTASGAHNAVRTRRNLNGMALDDPDLDAYRDFVRIMQAKDQTQPLSWLGFSQQHGWVSADLRRGAYKFCPHGDWYFLPWHRAYVLMYESAVQTLTRKADFAMPYWDWTADRQYPQAFSDPMYKGRPNPLFVARRNSLTGSNALTDRLVGQDIIDEIYRETDFESFGTSRPRERLPDGTWLVQNDLNPKWVPMGNGLQGPLENPPHNWVHNNIGQFMPTPGSPRDPIFFAHHSNIDRIWAYWNALGRTNSTDPLWLNMPFTDNYIDPTGRYYSATVKDLQDTVALGYTYPDLPAPDNVTPDPERARVMLALNTAAPGQKIEGVQKVGGPNTIHALVTKSLHVSHAMSEGTVRSVVAPPANKRPREVFALINGITLGEGVSHVRVFINKPDVSIETPVTDPHFVRDIAFLAHPTAEGSGHDHGTKAHEQSVRVNLTRTIKKLGLKTLDADTIVVQLQPVPKPGVAADQVEKTVVASIEVVVV